MNLVVIVALLASSLVRARGIHMRDNHATNLETNNRKLMEPVITVSLIDADSTKLIGQLEDGAEITLDPNFSGFAFEAKVNQEVDGIVFGWMGNRTFNTEHLAPYSLYGDKRGTLAGEPLSPGTHMLNATIINSNPPVFKTVTFSIAYSSNPTPSPIDDSMITLSLIDADTNGTLVNSIDDGAVIVLDSNEGGFAIEATVDALVPGIQFGWMGNPNFRTERYVPYYLFGDRDGVFGAEPLPAGTHTLNATALGTSPLVSKSVTFTVRYTENTEETVPIPIPTIVLSLVDTDTNQSVVDDVQDGMVIILEPNLSGYAFEALVDQEIDGIDFGWMNQTRFRRERETPYTLYGGTQGLLNGAILPAGSHTLTARILNSNPTISKTIAFTIEYREEQESPSPVPPTKSPTTPAPTTNNNPAITLSLIDANLNIPIDEDVEDGAVFTLEPSQSGFSFEASVDQEVAGIVFAWRGDSSFQTELRAPYTLYGDDAEGDYFGEPLPAGTHSLTATIVDSNPIVSKTVTFTIEFDGRVSPDVLAYPASSSGMLSGTLQTWHKLTLGFRGPSTSETADPNPFTDFRLDVTFVHSDTGTTYLVPGYFAGDGNAANTHATGGNVWLVHFAPDLEGQWSWSASFSQGSDVALYSTGLDSSAGFFDGSTGSFDILATDKIGRDLRGKGRLNYVSGKHHLQFMGNKEWFLKAGVDSPENLLAYEDFDNTPNVGGRLKSWELHQRDYRVGDPTWDGGKGSELIGAINYLASHGMNAFSFLTMNIEGDDENVFPYVSSNEGSDRLRIDVSKLAQWEVVLEHADQMGMFLHFKTQETENDHLLDEGQLGDERRLYYRELISRFGHHLALNWNIGEENTNTAEQQKAFAAYFKDLDPYLHPVVLHTFPESKFRYEALLGDLNYDGASLQISPTTADEDYMNVFNETLQWRLLSAAAGKTWVVCNDEQGQAEDGIVPDGNEIDPEHDIARTNVLWGNLMAGGAGVEYYFGYAHENSDLTAQDYRSRELMLDQSSNALEFFRENDVPYWNMANVDSLVSEGWSLADSTYDTVVLYLRNASGETFVDLRGITGSPYSLLWFNPKTGGSLQEGSVQFLEVGREQLLGDVPSGSSPDQDWVIILRR